MYFHFGSGNVPINSLAFFFVKQPSTFLDLHVFGLYATWSDSNQCLRDNKNVENNCDEYLSELHRMT